MTASEAYEHKKCWYCGGEGGQMEETPFEDRCYSSTSSGEFNGPSWVKCKYCNGTGELKVKKYDGK